MSNSGFYLLLIHVMVRCYHDSSHQKGEGREVKWRGREERREEELAAAQLTKSFTCSETLRGPPRPPNNWIFNTLQALASRHFQPSFSLLFSLCKCIIQRNWTILVSTFIVDILASSPLQVHSPWKAWPGSLCPFLLPALSYSTTRSLPLMWPTIVFCLGLALRYIEFA